MKMWSAKRSHVVGAVFILNPNFQSIPCISWLLPIIKAKPLLKILTLDIYQSPYWSRKFLHRRLKFTLSPIGILVHSFRQISATSFFLVSNSASLVGTLVKRLIKSRNTIRLDPMGYTCSVLWSWWRFSHTMSTSLLIIWLYLHGSVSGSNL